ncbi:hypothetical protein KIN20_011827 [Parelaphostrongylus tenuis]|uniref:Uncharacterized protein n=1 Tax=Parelaphostrongylus tenuis TaxID=148309 RepID=A0AAD5QMR1_PARTN|nr:hypothetical protein KIN20_011827 [Parelaphostrongylus tenuis]
MPPAVSFVSFPESSFQRSMPRVRIRSADTLINCGPLERFARFITGGERWTHHHLTVFVLTFFSFAFIHAARKTLSTVKPSLIAAWTHGTPTSPALFPSDQAASEFSGRVGWWLSFWHIHLVYLEEVC